MNKSTDKITVEDAKRLVRSTQKGFAPRLAVRDISGANSFGYDFAIVRQKWDDNCLSWVEIETLAVTHDSYNPDATNKKKQKGAFRPMFYRHEIETIINE